MKNCSILFFYLLQTISLIFFLSCKANYSIDSILFTREETSSIHEWRPGDTLYINMVIDSPSKCYYGGIIKRSLWENLTSDSFVIQLSEKIDTMSLESICYNYINDNYYCRNMETNNDDHIIYKNIVAKIVDSGIPDITTYLISDSCVYCTKDNEWHYDGVENYLSFDNRSGLLYNIDDFIRPELKDSLISLVISEIMIQIQKNQTENNIDWNPEGLHNTINQDVVCNSFFIFQGKMRFCNKTFDTLYDVSIDLPLECESDIFKNPKGFKILY